MTQNKIDSSKQDQSSAEVRYNFVNDEPLINPELDRLNRWPFAQRVAKTIINRNEESCLVISINGIWGDGKTTVLNFIELALSEEPKTVTIRYNPWLFGNTEDLLRGLLYKMAAALKQSITKRHEKIGTWLKEYSETLLPFQLGYGPFNISGTNIKNIGEKLSDINLEDLKKRIDKVFKTEKIKIVIFVDDIERLDKTEIRDLFKLIKLALDFKYTTFVLAYDKDLVASALHDIYPSKNDSIGFDFQEKIINVPLDLPLADEYQLRSITLEGVEEALRVAGLEINQEEVHRFVHAFDKGLKQAIKTPRLSKRYTNAVLFTLPILEGEVNITDLLLVEGVRICYPLLYNHIKENRDSYLCTGIGGYSGRQDQYQELEKKYRKARDSILTNYSSTKREAIEKLLKELFPKTQTMTVESNKWILDKRICTQKYFYKYFSYSISSTDISDKLLDNIFSKIENHQIEEAFTFLKKRLNNSNSGTFIEKIYLKKDFFKDGSAASLTVLLSKIGKSLPFPDTLFRSFITPLGNASQLISELLLQISDIDERFVTAQSILKLSTPLFYSRQILDAIHSQKEKEIFDEDNLAKLNKTLGERVQKKAKETVIYLDDSLSEYTPSLFRSWKLGLGKEKTNNYLKARFQNNPKEVLFFIRTYIPSSWSSAHYGPKKTSFDIDQYNSISKVVDPKIICDSLTKIFGQDIHKGKIQGHEYMNYDQDEYMARRFSYFFRKAHKEL